MKTAIIAIAAVVFVFSAIFVAAPQVFGENISIAGFSLSAKIAEACCGPSDPGPGDGDDDPKHPIKPVAPVCTLNADPSRIDKGDESTLFWTSNLSRVSIETSEGKNVVGSDIGIYGSKDVSPSKNTTYIATFWDPRGGDTITCKTTVKVTQPPKSPICTMDANPVKINKGETAKLTWTSKHADTARINQGIGSVKLNGFTKVSPTKTTTYTSTFKNSAGDKVQCQATVKVKDDPEPPKKPSCTLNINKSKITLGESAKLTWTSKNATSLRINQGIGKEDLNGSLKITPKKTGTFTYTATVIGEGPEIAVECSDTIKVVKEPSPKHPSCTLDINKSKITLGQKATLTWTSKNATSVKFNPSIGTNDLDGSVKIKPTKTGTFTYKGTFKNDAGDEIKCSDTITVVKEQIKHPSCTLDINKSKITLGQRATLTWTSENATSVKFNRDVGSLDLNGSVKIKPTETGTFTYRGTFVNDAGDAVTCKDTIKVVDKPIDPPSCTFDINKSKITLGESARITWTSKNTVRASINYGVGKVDLSGTQKITPDAVGTFKYVGTFIGEDGSKIKCKDTIVVEKKNVTPRPVCDSFTATPKRFTNGTGGDVTLRWETTDAASVRINQGVKNVPVDGTTVVNVTETTTFTLTAKNGGKSVQCSTTVTVKDSPSPLSCDRFESSDYNVEEDEEFTLFWNTTGATHVSISPIIGSVPVDSSRVISIDDDTTFILTATDGTDTEQCSVFIRVDEDDDDDDRPRCDLDISDSRIDEGDSITLSWDNDDTDEIILEDDDGNVLIDTDDGDDYDPEDDRIRVKPRHDTEYTLIAYNDGRKDECEVDVEVDEDDSITILSTRDQLPLIGGIPLARVPYTGFEAGPMLSALFYTLLALWGIGIAYFLTVRRRSVLDFATASAGAELAQNPAPVGASPYVSSVSTQVEVPTVPANLPVATNAPTAFAATPVVESTSELDEATTIENRAHAARVLLSADAREYIARKEGTLAERLALLDTVIANAKAMFPSENGWMVINKERMLQLIG